MEARKRTVLYGVLMLLFAMISGLFARDLPTTWLRVLAYLALLVIALVGFVMTFRDYS
ncbi:hypothetical protein [Nocardia sp. NPDC051832]|uniref:hypothetical protein n=1 Tax=Nocardia sp. NPDC051832 TaxID=3155673 RepID=UPI00341C1BC8